MNTPHRYLLTWREKNDFKWHQLSYLRNTASRIKRYQQGVTFPFRYENLETGQIIATNFDLRQHARFVTTQWPKRTQLLRQWEKFRASKAKPDPQVLAQRKLAALTQREKQWQRKLKLATTKLRKLRTQIKRLSGEHTRPACGVVRRAQRGSDAASEPTCAAHVLPTDH